MLRRSFKSRGVGLVGLLVGGAMLLGACGGDDDGESEADATVTATESTVESSAEQVPRTNLNKAGVAERVRVAGDWLAAGEGAIWISDGREIRRLDPKTGEETGTVAVPDGACEASDVDFGFVWTATCTDPGLAKIDPDSLQVADRVSLRIPKSLDGEGSIGTDAGAVWLVVDGDKCDACAVARVNPSSLKVEEEIPVEEGAAGVRAADGAVWVTNPLEDLVEKIDPNRSKVVHTEKVGPSPRFLAVGEGAVWILNQTDGSITKIDPESGETTATIQAEMNGAGGDIAAGGGSVWPRSTYTLLARVDPNTDQVVERYEPSSGSGAVIVGYGAVWISAHDVETVWRLPLP